MSANYDGLQGLVRAWAEATYNDPGEKPTPMASDDAREVIKSQLTENTGTHFLDSGSAYGRHWEENQDNPPWEQPQWEVGHGYVVQNVYHYMDRELSRDRLAVALETLLYEYGYNGPGEGDAWLTVMEDVADLLPEIRREQMGDMPEEFQEDILGYSQELRTGRDAPRPKFTVNTYESEFADLSQVLQLTKPGGPYGEYVFLQVHQGADVRGGYTGPRVYSHEYGVIPEGEYHLRCERCEWQEAESVAWDDEHLLFQPDIDWEELFEAVIEESPDHVTDEMAREMVEETAAEAEENDDRDGAVFHTADGCGGIVHYM